MWEADSSVVTETIPGPSVELESFQTQSQAPGTGLNYIYHINVTATWIFINSVKHFEVKA